MKHTRFITWAMLVVSGAVASASPIPYITSLNGFLLKVDAANNTPTNVGPSGLATDSLAQDINGNLWAASASGGLYQVNGSGSTFVTNLPSGNIGDLDCDAFGIWGFSNATSTLFYYSFTMSTVVLQTPVPTLLGSTVTGVAYDSGRIYLSTQLGNMLYMMPNPIIPIISFVGLMPTTDNNFGDIDFDPASGQLYGVTYNNRSWYTINPNNGLTQLVTPTTSGVLDITGIAMPVAAPEPSTWLALGFGTVLLIRRRR